MIELLMMAMLFAAGASSAFDDVSGGDDTEAEEEQDITEADLPDLLNGLTPVVVNSAPAPVEGTQDQDAFRIDAGNINPFDLGFVEYFGQGELNYLEDDGENGLIEVNGSDGDDRFVVESGRVVIATGGGADIVDARAMQGGLIHAGAGDLIFGADDPMSDLAHGVVMDGAGTFRGGDAAEFAVAHGDGAVLDGGKGDDILLSVDGASTLIGGDGDDIIDAAAFDNEYGQNTNNTQGGPDQFVDIIDAGAGNDRVEDVANGDVVTLGRGADEVQAIYSAALLADPITFTDFNPVQDSLTIELRGFDSTALADRTDILHGDGDAHLFVDDTLVAVFEGTQNLVATPFIQDIDASGLSVLGLTLSAA